MRLVPTGDVAKAFGVSRGTIHNWVRAGLLKPDVVTPSGHLRWDIDRLRREGRLPPEESDPGTDL
ncbi:MAG: MerR family DNA-binding transcriptional regulator [Pseudonocardiaceae bacterium]|nr:MerR family DNA-binding transcriptional regulator [Pseudonocardiaceae bacterium]